MILLRFVKRYHFVICSPSRTTNKNDKPFTINSLGFFVGVVSPHNPHNK